MNSYRTIRTEIVDLITTISFNRPQSLNSITIEFMEELEAACQQIAQDSESRAVIFTGNGRAFSSGLDLSLLAQAAVSMPVEELRALVNRWQQVFTKIEDLPQVTLAAINGPALGGGLELALSCDFRIASTRALFGLPEVKLGIIPDLGGIGRLTRIVGSAKTKELVLRGRNVSAIEALHIGLVNRVSEPGDLMGTARKWCSQFVTLPRPAVVAAKRLINSSLDDDLSTGLRSALETQIELLSNEEFRSAIRAAREEKPTEV